MLTRIPLQDNYDTTLSQQLLSSETTWGYIYVTTVPTFTFPSGFTTSVKINPGTTLQEEIEIDQIDSVNKRLRILTRALDLGAWITGTAQTHSQGSSIIISDSYAFWDKIQSSLNAFDGKFRIFANDTARDSAIPTPAEGQVCISWWVFQIYISSAWASPFAGMDYAKTRVVAPASADNGEIYRNSSDSNNVYYKNTSWTSTLVAIVVASKSEAQTGTSNEVSMTPLRTRNEIVEKLNYYGTGSDGDVTITTTVTLTSDKNYNNLTITSPWILVTAWYKVYVNWTLSGDGIIQRNGNNGSNGGNASAGTGGALGAGGAVLTQNNLWLCYAGTDGKVGVSFNVWNASSSTSNSNTFISASNYNKGGNGWVWYFYNGATGGSATSTWWELYNLSVLKVNWALASGFAVASLPILFNTLLWGVGWASGWANDSAVASWGGGGGGSTGGIVFLSVRTKNFTGTIKANGWNGWNAGNGYTTSSPTGTGWSGGGAGWSGGIVNIICGNLTALSTVQCIWGNGWNGSNAVGDRNSEGGGGGAGWNGGAFVWQCEDSFTGTATLTGGTGGTGWNGIFGGANGATGATGTTGTQINVTI